MVTIAIDCRTIIGLVLLLFSLLPNGYPMDLLRRNSNTCKSNSDCPIYAFCEHNTEPTENGLCVCQDGYMIIAENKQRKCYKVASSINEECMFDEQCMHKLSTEAECWNNFCRCRVGTHYVKRDKACYKSVKLGDFCRLTNNCIGDETSCQSGICVCPMNTHPRPDNLQCINDVRLGYACNSDYECINDNSRCHNVCRCKISHIINHNRTKCLRIVDRLGGACEEDRQCAELIADSVCGQNGTCVCAEGFHELNQQCWTTVSHAGICETDENCSVTPGAVCLSGRCDCSNGLSYDKGECSSSSTKHYFSNLLLSLLLILISFKLILVT
ncbi:prion-like-(Q/N-rich) domain-bearing protein 25 [Bradysia coprophila]|uniref:prion-like-(Q/N-rich) domain-bearing protein 25 n=1 Tax=Bradysia coprophila TaxID=38358 RepID=UPI00187D7034|nr:prion-like-(Q/N-rich) domain-bearing protein 25 [Bradysia coprophila]